MTALGGCGSGSAATRPPAPTPPSTTAGRPPATPAPSSPSVPVATAPAARPHILLVIEENVGYQATLGECGNGSPDPYLCSLAAEYVSVTGWYAIEHPSLPNYLDLVSGSDQGCSGDGCAGPYTAPDLGGQMTAAGIPWVAYMESMPSACYTGFGSGDYYRQHDPFVLFSDVTGRGCTTAVQPYPGPSGLVAALGSAGAPDFVWITPNVVDDMHSASIQRGDAWLRANLSGVLGSAWFTDGGTVIVTMDENDADGSGSCCGDAAGGRVPMVVISAPDRGRGTVAESGDHFGTLRTIEEAFGLPLLGAAREAANGDLSELIG